MTAEVVEMAMRHDAAQKRGELAAFVGWLLDQRRARTVLEIGTLRGGTLSVWCQTASTDAVICSVDLPGGPWGGGYPEQHADRLRQLARPSQRLSLIRGDSHTADVFSLVYDLFNGTGVDLLFIDGDHSYEGVKQDFGDYAPLVNDGGIVVFHDVLPHPDVPGCDVDRFWREISPCYESVEFTDPADRHPTFGQWGGIGALIV